MPPTGQSIETVKAEAQAVGSGSSKLRLSRTSDLKAPKATILLYGPPRWGKTHSIQTLDKPLILATELGDTQGLMTLQHLNLPFIAIENTDHLTSVTQDLIRNNCVVEGEKFNSVVLDSLSNLGYQWLEDGVKAQGWKDLNLTGGAGKDPRRAYMYLAEKGRRQTMDLLDIPAHLVMICRETLNEEGEGKDKVTFAAPELPGQKLGRELPGWPDAVLRGDFVQGKRVLRTRTYARAVAGIRTPGNIEVPEFVLPNLGALCRLMIGDRSALEELVIKKPEPARPANAAVPPRK